MKKDVKIKKSEKRPFAKKKVQKEEIEDENVREIVVERDNGFNIVEVIVIILISILFGLVIGYILSSSRTFGSQVSDEASEIVTTYDTILKNYYDEVEPSELADAAIAGMIGILDDPYSIYMNSGDTESFLESVNGSFVGIGINVEWNNNQFKIISVFEDSPASNAGLKVDDIIIKVDDKSVEGLTLDEMSALIKGKSGSKVRLTVKRGEEEITLVAKRGTVEIPSVSSDILEESIGYIKIDNFSATTSEQFSKKLKKMEEDNITSLVIDVRDNPGGKLGQVNKILEQFFNKKTVLYQIVTKDKTSKVKDDTSEKRDYPIVVLVNNGSASAAEILAASFQDNYKDVTVVGTVTYGKGTIQKAIELSSGASIKYTTQKWLTPKGKWINEKGVIPDEVIEQGDKYGAEPIYSNDVQLQKAVEILKK